MKIKDVTKGRDHCTIRFWAILLMVVFLQWNIVLYRCLYFLLADWDDWVKSSEHFQKDVWLNHLYNKSGMLVQYAPYPLHMFACIAVMGRKFWTPTLTSLQYCRITLEGSHVAAGAGFASQLATMWNIALEPKRNAPGPIVRSGSIIIINPTVL